MEEEVNISNENLEKIKSVDFEPIYRQKTLVVSQYTLKPEKECTVLDGSEDEDTGEKRPEVTSIEGLFNHYQPEANVQFEKDSKSELFQFRDITHFLPDGEEGFINQSVSLSSYQAECKALENFSVSIVEDDDIYKALNDSKAREALVGALGLLTQMLDSNE